MSFVVVSVRKRQEWQQGSEINDLYLSCSFFLFQDLDILTPAAQDSYHGEPQQRVDQGALSNWSYGAQKGISDSQ